MPFTTDTTTDIGKVRLLISDMDSGNPVFPDDGMIQAFLDLESESIRLAAALALETIAASRVMTMQVVKLLDLQMDGKSTAQAFLAIAKQWRDTDNDDWAGIDFAQQIDNSDFAFREYYLKLVVQQSAGGGGGL